MQRTRVQLMTLVGGLFVWTGCEPVSEQERAYFEARAMEEEQEGLLMETKTEWNTVDGAIEMARTTMMADTNVFAGTHGEWVRARVEQVRGDVMFPRWEGQRKGANRFEVRYTHTEIDDDYNLERVGFTWNVDTMLKLVDGPQPIDPAELAPRERPRPELKPLDGFTEDFSLE